MTFVATTITKNEDGTFTITLDDPRVNSDHLTRRINNSETHQYHVYAGLHYYPNGGFKDYKGSFPTEVEALKNVAKIAINESVDWYQVVYKGEIIDTDVPQWMPKRQSNVTITIPEPPEAPHPFWMEGEEDFGATFHD